MINKSKLYKQHIISIISIVVLAFFMGQLAWLYKKPHNPAEVSNNNEVNPVPKIIHPKNKEITVGTRFLVEYSPVDGLKIHKNHKYSPEKNRNIVSKENELILFVRYSDEVSVQNSLNHLGLKLKRILQSDGTVIACNPDNISSSDINKLAAEDKNILYIMDNCIRAKRTVSETHDITQLSDSNYVPNDPFFEDMWHLSDKNGISVSKAWETTKGSEDILVAIIDSGIVPNHPEFAGKIYKQYDIPDNNSSAEDTADFSHGSHVAGIIAANADNNVGICGIASGVKLLIIDIFYYDEFFEDEIAEDDDIFTAYDLCISEGANVANMSFGGYPDGLNSNISRIYNNKLRNLERNNIVSVAAAGNESTTDEILPSDCEHIISVIATDKDDKKSNFSNYGTNKDISAPGEDIISIKNATEYAKADGTSMAAPIVSGVVALLLSYKKDLSPSQIENIIYSTATRLGDATSSCKDPKYGYGKINAAAAMDKLIELFPPAPATVAPAPTNGSNISTDLPNFSATPNITVEPNCSESPVVSETANVTPTPKASTATTSTAMSNIDNSADTTLTTPSHSPSSTPTLSAKKPARVKLKKVKNLANRKIKVTFKKAKRAKKYQIAVSMKKNFAKKKTKYYTTKKLSYIIKELMKNKTYFIKVRGFCGEKANRLYGTYSKVKNVKIIK